MLINREQHRVIDEVEQNILLLASAGTGKTNTLAYRWRLVHSTAFAFSFSNKRASATKPCTRM